ncbi:DUF559 domain-containing protein [Roseovarius spongiae]|uniref:DUF559 domain-containing protein n=1 Tax=Roseovarius spongiae TaxID=2320272 RepID=A0A3A8ARJ7_9RHOB|nr:AAA domain-containing protein [Roseovarius spongiae]RKF13530.1 DUF559 domain-containing protein [Roseovarius spongiae]
MTTVNPPASDNSSHGERKNLSGLLGFAQGVLTARTKVQMSMQAGLGVFHEGDVDHLPGVHLHCDDGAWLRIDRQPETRPPEAVDYVARFFAAIPSDPSKLPKLKPAIQIDVTIEDASDLEEAGLLSPEDVHVIVEDGIEVENRVRVILHAENCPEMRRDFERYTRGDWADWAHAEKPVRRAIAFYNDLFKIHSAIHTSEGTPPEIVWGIGIGRWETGSEKIDMPIIEQLIDIELEDGGAISIRPRELPPQLSLKPYLEVDVDGSPKLQRDLQERLSQILVGEEEFSPFTTLWEPLLDTATSNLAPSAVHVTRAQLDEGASLESIGKDLRVTSSWAIFGRPRSIEARAQDLAALRKQIDDETATVPASIRRYATTPPDEPKSTTSSFGLNTAVIGANKTPPEPSATGGASMGRVPGAGSTRKADKGENGRRVHFFPLPYNEEQGKISDMIDDAKVHVVGVSGPPGTGKSHTIANIISHQMATGNRVLVTARTPEAIAAVREKLPPALQPLVIASVGTDRDSAQQLQDAVSELSREVVTLNEQDAEDQMHRLEVMIVACDETAEEADAALAEIARANLAQMTWDGAQHTPMDLVDILAAGEEAHGWFTDRPSKPPPAQLDETLGRLATAMPALAADTLYAGADLPAADALPGTAELVAAHDAALAWSRREVVDYSSAPPMALDSAGAESQARKVLRELLALSDMIAIADANVRGLAVRALRDDGAINRSAIEATHSFLSKQRVLDQITTVRFEIGACGEEDFMQAATRGASGQKPVGFGLFNGALKSATASVRVNGKDPSGTSDWQAVLEACRLQQASVKIADTLRPFVSEQIMPALPSRPWEIAQHLKDRQTELEAALDIATRLKPVIDALEALFPYGLDSEAIKTHLDCSDAIFAIRGNLPDDYVAPEALERLRQIAGSSSLPILAAIGSLANALGQEGTDPTDVVKERGAITRELTRLSEVAPRLKALGADLDALRTAGAPEWVERLEERPEAAGELIPDTWRASWAWAEAKARLDCIVALGNGDDHRRIKSEAIAQRRKHFEDLIRTRTLLGLKDRMTPSIRTAMEAFTQAVSKIGTGKGKRAPRFIRAAQEAARKASPAAPVWIMPEYRIPEQLPAKFGDFDLVILDEASQSDITALAALARGKKILVVGDEEQVSPSSVGIPDQKINALRAEFIDTLPMSGLIDQNTSIFEMTKRMHPDSHVMLREHFRCVAPIIQFSTRFYNNALVPLRVPKASERFDPPLADVYIAGATRHGKINASEARWIVDEIAGLIEDPAHEGRDIGVISLIGNEQAERIGRMLVEDERIGPEQIEKRRIIYGDARTMQGQERSIVFLSMVATPGHATAQTSKADQQRINVAMSRAKDRLYLVRSVSLEDLKPTDIKAHILQHFADPMPEGRAATGKETANLMDRCDSGFEREVLQRLMDAGYRVQPQVPAGGFRIDLVVEGTEDRRLAIELDGDQYHGPDVWDRDMARQAALERAGWVFWRVFGSQWKSNREFWWDSLIETLDRLGIEPIGSEAVDERFTETIVVDPWETVGSTPDNTEDVEVGTTGSGEDAGTQGAAALEAPADHDREVSPDSAGTKTFPATAREDMADPAEESDAGHSDHVRPSVDEEPGVPPKNAKTAARRTGAGPLRRADQQQRLPLEDDLFSVLAPASPDDDRKPATGVLKGDDMFALSAAEGDAGPGPVRAGSTVRLEKLGNGGGKLEVTIVEDGHNAAHGMIGIHTPLAQALLEAEVGEEVEYKTGAYLQEVRILAIS